MIIIKKILINKNLKNVIPYIYNNYVIIKLNSLEKSILEMSSNCFRITIRQRYKFYNTILIFTSY